MPESSTVIRQREVPADIRVNGVDNWRSLFEDQIELHSETYQKVCGGKTARRIVYCIENAQVNDVSLERVIISDLLTRGYTVEELVCEQLNNPEWGVCTWHKEHPSYPTAHAPGSLANLLQLATNLCSPMFASEMAGEVQGVFYSMQMLGGAMIGQPRSVLVHKTVVFHKVVLSPPPANPA